MFAVTLPTAQLEERELRQNLVSPWYWRNSNSQYCRSVLSGVAWLSSNVWGFVAVLNNMSITRKLSLGLERSPECASHKCKNSILQLKFAFCLFPCVVSAPLLWTFLWHYLFRDFFSGDLCGTKFAINCNYECHRSQSVSLFLYFVWQPEFIRNMYFTIEWTLRELAVCVPDKQCV